jgi:beta-lactamase superfamily II metal-dependent hydrolase
MVTPFSNIIEATVTYYFAYGPNLNKKQMLERCPELRADIVIAGLPAAEEPLCEPLLDCIQPKAIVICDSEFPASARAKPELMERLGRRKVRVLYTRECGAVTISFENMHWKLITFSLGTGNQ